MMTSVAKNDKCTSCNKVVRDNDDSICCDDCLRWIHRRCAKINKADFIKICKNSNIPFTCIFCLKYRCGKCEKPVYQEDNAIQCDHSECKL